MRHYSASASCDIVSIGRVRLQLTPSASNKENRDVGRALGDIGCLEGSGVLRQSGVGNLAWQV